MAETTIRKVLRHEGLTAVKLTSIAFTSQLILQCFQVSHTQFSAMSRLIIAVTILVLGVKSDARFYHGNVESRIITWEKLVINISFLVICSSASLYFISYLEISGVATLEDPDMLGATGSEGPDLFHTKLMQDFGSVSGVILILCTYFTAIFALVSFSRIVLVLLQLIILSLVKHGQLFNADKKKI